MSEAGMFDALARVLSEARTELGVQQDEMAKRAGISQSMLSAYEKGKKVPRLETLGKLLDALGLDVEELGRRLRGRRGPRPRYQAPEDSGYVPERTAVAIAELLEDLGAMTRLAIRRPAPAKKRAKRARRRTKDAGDR